ncbi:MAG TPA: cation diffusion facilitator family transporter [Acidobacteriota bacterium]|nr:cation diffusion facilitator family transporter [Acidobacteriota bacterium]
MHDHAHDIDKSRRFNNNRRFALGTGLNVVFVLVEAGCGFYFGSLALLADAGHNLSDVVGLLLAWGGDYLSRRSPTLDRTYGFRRATILAALGSSILVILAVGLVIWEAVERLLDPSPVSGLPIIVVAGIGVVVNGLTTLLFYSGRKTDLNVRGAFVHMAADTGISLGVVISGLLLLWRDWPWLDPAVGLAVAAVIVVGSWPFFIDSLNMALDKVPSSVDPAKVLDYLRGLEGVEDVHDLHIWPMSTRETALTVHLVAPDASRNQLLKQALHGVEERFSICHCTIQVEEEDLDEELGCL